MSGGHLASAGNVSLPNDTRGTQAIISPGCTRYGVRDPGRDLPNNVQNWHELIASPLCDAFFKYNPHVSCRWHVETDEMHAAAPTTRLCSFVHRRSLEASFQTSGPDIRCIGASNIDSLSPMQNIMTQGWKDPSLLAKKKMRATARW